MSDAYRRPPTEADAEAAAAVIGTAVRLHVNLTNGSFTICDPKGKRIAGVYDAVLSDVTFRVSEARRQWIINNRKRKVHAYAFGVLVSVNTQPITDGLTGVTYNPFRAPTFTTIDGEPVDSAKTVAFVDRKGWME